MSAPLVLIVDDHDAGRFAKAQVLRRAGFRIIEAATGTEALDMVERESPDVVILDVNLPDISGLEVSRRLRTSDTAAKLPILQVSATATSVTDHVQGLEHGADVYVAEPLDPAVLTATVRALVRARRAETALSEALASEKAARALAEEANAVKTDFIATLSHELRTPLNALLGSVWQLRHAVLDEAARTRALERIERSAAAQARLVNDLLDLSRIAKGKLPITLSLVDAAEVLDESVDSVKPAAVQKGIRLVVTRTSAITIADPARLQQVFVNLLTNAIQFTPSGGEIRASLAADGHEVLLRIDDTGSGIDPEFLPYVFEQFRQGEGGLSRKHGGLGLGLSVVRQLIELHDGSVSATSDGKNQGASFFVRLQREQLPAGAKLPRLALAAVSVVLVDEQSSPDVVAAFEGASGGHLVVVSTCDEAVACLSHVECDAVVVATSACSEALREAHDRRGTRPVIIEVAAGENPVGVVRRTFRLTSQPQSLSA